MKKSYPFFFVILALIFSLTAMSSDIGESRVYTRVNLVSDIDGVARF